MARLRSVAKYPGGKGAIVHKLLNLAPSDCMTLVETHAGMLSFLLNSPKREREIANDSNPDVVNFWVVIRDHCDEFLDAVSFIDYSEENFKVARNAPTIDKFGDPPKYTADWRIDHAIAFFVRHRMSRSGDGKSYSWSERPRGGQPESLNAWQTIQKQLPLIAARVKDVEFRCGDALRLIYELRNDENVLWYVDPPYWSEERKTKNLYVHEMTAEQHVDLLYGLDSCSGKVMISGYRNPLYADQLSMWSMQDWNATEFPVKCCAGQTKVKSDRVEVVWRNFS